MEEAEEELRKIEDAVRASGQELEPVDDSQALELKPEKRYGYVTFLGLVFRTDPKRAVLGATLIITQSFLYNASTSPTGWCSSTSTAFPPTRCRSTGSHSRSATCAGPSYSAHSSTSSAGSRCS